MLRPSKLVEKLEDLVEKKCGPWYERHKAKFPLYIPMGLVAWYFYGMLLNSLKLGRQATFHLPGQEVQVHPLQHRPPGVARLESPQLGHAPPPLLCRRSSQMKKGPPAKDSTIPTGSS